jgi:hypothetical protein
MRPGMAGLLGRAAGRETVALHPLPPAVAEAEACPPRRSGAGVGQRVPPVTTGAGSVG